MANWQRRLERLEAARSQQDTPAWPGVDASLTRQMARVRLKICRRLDIDEADPRVVDAMSLLEHDSPALVAQDEETVACWHRLQGIPKDASDVRQRLHERLETIARRLRVEEGR